MKWHYVLIPIVVLAGGGIVAITLTQPGSSESEQADQLSVPTQVHSHENVQLALKSKQIKPKDTLSDAVTGMGDSENSGAASYADGSVDDLSSAYEEVDSNPRKALLKHRVTAMQQRWPGKTFDEKEVAAAIARPSAWKPASKLPKFLPLKPEEFHDGRQFIEFDPIKLETMMPGDEMTVMIEDMGTAYQVGIDRVEVHGSQRVSWFGHLVGLEQDYRVSFTRGEIINRGWFRNASRPLRAASAWRKWLDCIQWIVV